MRNSRGFTVLELLVTLAIIAVVTTVTLPAYNSWTEGKSFDNAFDEIAKTMGDLKNEAQSRNATTRIVIAESSGSYIMTTYYSSSPTTTCSSAGTWTTFATKTLDIPSTYQITGTGIANTCFYRDGSSSGGTFIISPTDSESESETATITVTISTGYLDVVVN